MCVKKIGLLCTMGILKTDADKFSPLNLQDAVVVYGKEDRHLAVGFMKHLTVDVMNENENLDVKLYDDPRIPSLYEAFKFSSVAFVLLTRTFCENDWQAFSSHTSVIDSLYKRSSCTLVPVVVEKGEECEIPMALKCLKCLRYDFADEFYKQSLHRFLIEKINARQEMVRFR